MASGAGDKVGAPQGMAAASPLLGRPTRPGVCFVVHFTGGSAGSAASAPLRLSSETAPSTLSTVASRAKKGAGAEDGPDGELDDGKVRPLRSYLVLLPSCAALWFAAVYAVPVCLTMSSWVFSSFALLPLASCPFFLVNYLLFSSASSPFSSSSRTCDEPSFFLPFLSLFSR